MVAESWDDGVTSWDGPGAYWDWSNTRPVYPPLAAQPGTIYVPFTPAANTNFQFQATFDGKVYTVILTWGLFGQRYYVNIYSTSGPLVVSLPLIGSPADYNISMTGGYFTTSLVFRTLTNTFEIFG